MDFLIRGGTLMDGSGQPGVLADVAVEGGKIAAIDPPQLASSAAQDIPVLDATGCIVAPGFIDIHSHSDFTLLVDPRAVSSITQGVTLEVVGNCGHGCAPVRDPELVRSNIYGFEPSYGVHWTSMRGYLDVMRSARPAVNLASLVPNGNLRLATAGVVDRPSTQDEIDAMVRLLRESLDGGAIGYSTGLEYGIERGCTEHEIDALSKVAREFGGFYATHTRNLEGQPQEAIAEAIHTAQATDVPLQISHISAIARLTSESKQAVEQALEQVDSAVQSGLDVSFDMHTRLFGTTNLSAVLPPDALEGGKSAIEARLRDSSERRVMRERPNIVAALARGDWSRIVVFDRRQSIAELSAARGTDPYDTIYDLLLEGIDRLHEIMLIAHVYRAEDIEPAFRHPLCMAGSDATALGPDGPLSHKFFHGAYTWAAWYWHALVRDRQLFPPEEAIRRLTSLPARRLGLNDRGILRKGAWADITVFEPAQFADQGTVYEPNRLATGVRHVLVNGVPAVRNGALTGRRSGQVITR